MSLSLNQLLILNGGIVIFVVISFLVMRKSARQPVRLRLNEKTKLGVAPGGEPRPGASTSHGSVRSSTAQHDPKAAVEKSLNVIFNYNGHSWDAFEVLGVPAGSSPEAIRAGYEAMLKRTSAESAEFLRAAYEATRPPR